MGYSYSNNGKLCCDICSKAGARKYRCPFGHCPAIAACPACRRAKSELFTRAYHAENGCKTGHEKHLAWLAEREHIITEGQAVRCSAMRTDERTIHVLFQARDRTEGWYMSKETYDVLPLLDNFTADDYREHGQLTPAPADYGRGRTTKQVVLA